MSGGWAGSTRATRLPDDWPARRDAVLRRDRRVCQIQMPGCVDLATEADHIEPGDNHELTNLQAACYWCHGKKSSAEGNAARPRYSMHRPAERHPGLL